MECGVSPLCFLNILECCAVSPLLLTSDKMSKIWMCGLPHLILKHLISSVVSLASLVYPSVALQAELIITSLYLLLVFLSRLVVGVGCGGIFVLKTIYSRAWGDRNSATHNILNHKKMKYTNIQMWMYTHTQSRILKLFYLYLNNKIPLKCNLVFIRKPIL